MKKTRIWILMIALSLSLGLFMVGCGGREPSEYIVVYAYEDGATPDLTEIVRAGGYATTPETPTRAGYTFVHWADEAGEYDFTAPVFSDLRLSAVWQTAETPPADTERKLVWEETEAYRFETSNGIKPTKATVGSVLTFGLWTSPYYIGAPVVKANDTVVPLTDGVYEVTVEADTKISVTGLKFDDTPIEGTGYRPTSGGDRAAEPYIIETAGQLKRIADCINEGATPPEGCTDYRQAAYLLAADIDLKGVEWTPIGSMDAPFQGAFETANFNTVSNFKITKIPEGEAPITSVGFFGMVAAGNVYGLNLDNFEIDLRVGAQNDKAVFAGGIAGYHFAGYVESCFARGKVNVVNDSLYLVSAGGLVGMQEAGFQDMMGTVIPYNANLNYCGADVSVTALGPVYTGGLLGYSISAVQTASIIQYCYAWGDVKGGMFAGGLVGNLGAYGSISDSYATGDVKALDYVDPTLSQSCAGGLAGVAEPESAIWNCFAAGSVSAASVSGNMRFGGLVGQSFDDPASVLTQRPTLILGAFRAGRGNNGAGTETTPANLKNAAFIKANLGWTDSIWKWEGDYPVMNFGEGSAQPSMQYITLDFGAKSVDYAFDADENPATGKIQQQIDTFDGMSLNWVEGYANKFHITDGLQSTDGYTAFAWYLGETGKEFRTYMPLRVGMTLTAGWSDYREVSHKYYLDSAKNLWVEFFPNGTLTVARDGFMTDAAYKYDGQTIYISSTDFGGLSLGPTEFLCQADGTELKILHLENGSPVNDIAYASTGFAGVWFLKTGESVSVLSLNPDRTGVFAGNPIVYAYDGSMTNPQITFTSSGVTYTGTLNQDDKELILNSVSYFRTDPAYGVEWVENTSGDRYAFDGLGATAEGGIVEITSGGSTERAAYSFNPDNMEVSVKGADGTAVLTLVYKDGYLYRGDKIYLTLDDPFYGYWTDGGGDFRFLGINDSRMGQAFADGDPVTYTVDSKGTARVYFGGALFLTFTRTEGGLLRGETPAGEGETPELFWFSRKDDFTGTWYTLDQSAYYTFNGNGFYDTADNVTLPTGEKLYGIVEYEYGGPKPLVAYYTVENGIAVFTMDKKEHRVCIDGRRLNVAAADVSETFYMLDRYKGEWIGTNGEKLSVNGTDTLTLSIGLNRTEYAYELDLQENIVLADGAGTGKIEGRYQYLELTIGADVYTFVKAEKQKEYDNKSYQSAEISFTLFGEGEGHINYTPYGKATVTDNTGDHEFAYVIDHDLTVWQGQEYLADVIRFYDYDAAGEEWMFLDESFYYLFGVFVSDYDGSILYENGAAVDPGFEPDVYQGLYKTHMTKDGKDIYVMFNGLSTIERGSRTTILDGAKISNDFYWLNAAGDVVVGLDSKSYRGVKQADGSIKFFYLQEEAFTWTKVTPEAA